MRLNFTQKTVTVDQYVVITAHLTGKLSSSKGILINKQLVGYLVKDIN